MISELPFDRLNGNFMSKAFDCGDEDLNDYLFSDALNYQNQLLAVTYYKALKNEIIFYFSLSNDKISSIETSNAFWRAVKKIFPHSKHRKDYPAVKIGRLAVNKEFKGHGIHVGSSILDFIKNWMTSDNKTGCRFITVDAYRDAVPFYQKNGFMFMGREEQNRYEEGKEKTIAMYFDLLKI